MARLIPWRARSIVHAALFLAVAGPTIGVRAQSLHDQGWQSFPRIEQVLKKSYKGNYDTTVVKNDIFIFQKKVVIDEILNSDGGDVLIVADEVVLNAPIDTRVKFRAGPDYCVPPPSGSSSVCQWVAYEPANYIKSFDSLYLWREVYDPKKLRYVYEVAPRPQRLQGKPSTVAELMQLPSAQVPPSSSKEYGGGVNSVRPTDGADAPDGDVIWENVRSGSIRIFASKLELCDECKRAPSFVETVVHGDPFDGSRAVFLQTSGLKGGRGGAGSTLFLNSYQGPVYSMNGGLSGKPGRGGDAGDIEVHLINATFQDAANLRKLLQIGTAQAEGGRPAQSHQQRTPSYNRLGAVGNRSAFVNEKPVADLDRLIGRPGAVSVDLMDTDAALASISAYLRGAELTRNYAVDLILQKVARTPTLFSISPIDILRTFLAQELVRLQLALLETVVPNISGRPQAIVEFSKFFESLSCTADKPSNLVEDQRAYLERICEFKRVDGLDSLGSLLYRVGGLYQDVPRDINGAMYHHEIMRELSRIEKLVHIAIKEVGDVHQLVFGAITGAQREKLKAAIDTLEGRRAALQAAAEEAAKSSPTLAGFAKKLVDAGKNFAAGVAALEGGMFLAAAQSFYTGGQQLGDVLTANRFPTTVPNPASLDEAIMDARAELKAFEESVYQIRKDIVGAQKAGLRDLIVARDRSEQYRKNARFEFSKYLRGAIQQYLQHVDPIVLQSNLANIKSTFDEAKVPAALYLPGLRNLCDSSSSTPFDKLREKAKCVEFERGSEPFVVFSNGKQATRLPLLVVLPGTGPVRHSFDEAFDAQELVIRRSPNIP